MPTIEERVAVLEKVVAELQTKVDTHSVELENIPELIKAEFRLTNSQIARLTRDVADFREKLGQLQGLPDKMDALHRVMAEMFSELIAETRKRDAT